MSASKPTTPGLRSAGVPAYPAVVGSALMMMMMCPFWTRHSRRRMLLAQLSSVSEAKQLLLVWLNFNQWVYFAVTFSNFFECIFSCKKQALQWETNLQDWRKIETITDLQSLVQHMCFLFIIFTKYASGNTSWAGTLRGYKTVEDVSCR